ncbi:uncharacterized protein B0H18DRAFT_1116820 [Fomitopsis serialis]|uniref:uncharacterized protein n=1 Tax=Fomitopsis serialis TaxID=139415 RepID=UPI002008E45B|nr:uncharacterized protein B0H18DRAFT_1116820 [Neoantrodia serialis]KAH9930701.1 hypothetical protein B0H18DRAFT_1116820 [Neoantrodia serialis]
MRASGPAELNTQPLYPPRKETGGSDKTAVNEAAPKASHVKPSRSEVNEKLSAPSSLSADAWKLYVGQASKTHTDFVAAWSMQMDTLLLFWEDLAWNRHIGRLFSAVVTALVATTYPLLSPDTGAQSVQLLQAILATLQTNDSSENIASTALLDEPFTPEPYAVRVNAVWFASLVVSVSVSFLSILAKQWLFNMGDYLDSSPETCGRQHHEIKAEYERSISADIGLRARERIYITKHAELMDASVLARMVESFPRTEESTEQIVHELAHSPLLVKHRQLFVDAGVMPFTEASDLARILAQLLTEADEDDRVVDLSDKRMPIFFRGFLEDQSDEAEQSLINLSLCTPDAALTDTDDLVFFSHMLRLQLAASSEKWYTCEINKSVQEFYRRVAEFRGMAQHSVEDQLSLVNTVIYTGTRPVLLASSASKGEVEKERNEHRIRTLDTLSALMSNNPTMEYALLRQISWVVWMICNPRTRNDVVRDLLVPHVRGTSKLATTLARHLTPNYNSYAYPYAVLTLIECLLLLEAQSGEGEQLDRLHLLKTLVARYPLFLEEFRAVLRSALENIAEPSSQLMPSDLLRLLGRVVRLSLCLTHFSWDGLDILDVDRERVTQQTLDILLHVCDHNHRIESDAWEGIYSLAYSATSRFAVLQIEKRLTGPDLSLYSGPDDLEIGNASPMDVALTMSSILESASRIQDPPDAVKCILSMIALPVGRRAVDSATTYPFAVFRHLHSHAPQVFEVLDVLQRTKNCQAEAVEAAGALQQNLYTVV